jgi:hypothetical protein
VLVSACRALVFFLLGFLKDLRKLPPPDARPTGDPCRTVSHKTEFSYLNPNLMVPKIHSITLNVQTKRQTSSFSCKPQ